MECSSFMRKFRIMPQFWACAVLALMTGVASTSLSANTITMANYNGGVGEVTCTLGCSGFIGTAPVSLSATNADNYAIANNSEATELALLNTLLAAFSPARDLETYVNKIDTQGNGFSTSLQYFSIKQASEIYYFENTSGGSVTVALESNTNNYSHWTEYGDTVSAVPVPAAFWLFGTALIGFIGVSRRTRV